MSITKSEDYWKGYDDETNFAGGVAGIAYAETEPANTAALTSQSFPTNETQEYPALEYDQQALEAAGQKMQVKNTFTVDKTFTPGKMIQYVQDNLWITKAMAGTSGAVPVGSWCEVFKDGQRIRAAYGCYDTLYTLELSKTEAPKETIEYKSYDVKDTGTPANFSDAKVWLTTALKKHSDFTVTVDGGTVVDFDTLKLTITKEYTEKQSGEELHKYPYLQKQFWEVELSTFNYDSDHFLDLETSAADIFPLTIAGWGQTLTLVNMKIKKDSLNIKEVPEKGLKLYSCTFEIGGDSSGSALA